MENKKITELDQPKVRPTIEEQIAFLDKLSKDSKKNLEDMKNKFPDVVEWIAKGCPLL